MKKKWDRRAMRITSVGYIARQRMLNVTFENGDHFLLAVESVVPNIARRGTQADWVKMRIGETRDVIEVPARGTLVEIPWDRIRSVADPDFRAHLAVQAEERARRIGRRVKDMRLKAGLTRGKLAAMVGESPETLAQMETGHLDASVDMLEHIALALGKRLGDFVEHES
ncbi:MAG: helix-turn-helix transcriptional regulator [Planctomycetes bacterium]|nr:helix-turn-helix transcriptional regulator [Planctomycetota bacterium]